MKYDLPDLLEVFDDLLPLTNEDRFVYFLKYERQDGVRIQLSFSALEGTAGILVRLNEEVSASSYGLTNCLSIDVLDLSRKIVEIKAGQPGHYVIRSLLVLDGDSILMVESQE